ncbi:PAN domain protein [Ostertagia ostertagi]
MAKKLGKIYKAPRTTRSPRCYVKHPKTVFFSANKDCSAETPYIVYPTKQMHKKIITSYPGMNSVVACIAACIDNRKCKAVTYKVGLCILHGASPASDSSLLVDGSEQTMVIENGCQLTTEFLPSLLSNNNIGQ